ncbi:MAG: fimbrillin family protein [Bacteroidaceae bacterium]|nr:fimbrillin family protein [Bacteroidaceae bacterium]
MEPAAIGFHTHRIEEVGTRALISTTDDLRTPGFGVYGDKTVGKSSPQLVFENIKVFGTPWDYEPTKYWDRTAAYRFVAYAPYAPWTESESVTWYSSVDKTLTINGIPQWQKIDGDEIDYLVATSAGTAEQYLSQPTNGTVNLEFKHILAQLTVNIAKVSPAADYKVNGLWFEYVPTGDCNCVYDSSNESLSFIGGSTGQQNLLPTDANIKVGTSSTQLAHYLVAPFDLGTVNLQLSYTLGSSEPKTVPVPLGITKFESNHSYVFNLLFEAGSNISVSVTEVKNWETIEVTDDVYNW